MPLIVDGTAQAAIDSDARGVATLVELDFSGGTQRFTDWPVNILTGGNTYLGIGTLVDFRGLSESEDRSARKVDFAFTIVNSTFLAACIGPATVYRRKRARVYQQFMNSAYVPAGAAVQRWSGYMDQVSVDRDAPSSVNDGPGMGKVVIHCSRAGEPSSRRASGLRSTHQQQIERFPGDLGLVYQQKLVEQPSLWLSKKFQEI